MLSAIILAAGSSTRMGKANKLLLAYKAKTIIENLVETVIEAGIENIIVITGYEADKITHSLKNLPVQFVYNHRYAEGMTTSIQQGVINASGSGYMICLSDMVTITAAEYNCISNAFTQRLLTDDKCICLPRYNNEKGNPVIFSAYYRKAIIANQEMEGCKNIIQSHKENILWVEMNTPHVLEDFDYPDDYQKLVQ